jgi:hypothetical protein
MTERRTEVSRTYLNADGTRTAEIATRPIHYKAADGSFQPVDTTLTATNRAGFCAANETNPLRTYLPGNASGWVRVETDGAALSFRPVGAATSPIAVSDSRAAYADMAENVSLSYVVEPGRLKETITIAAPIANPTWAFVLRAEGLAPKASEDGSVSLADGTGRILLTLETPWMRDARGDVSFDVRVELTADTEGYVYTMSPDPQWLASAAYPVEIDPTVTVQTATWQRVVVSTAPSFNYTGVSANGNSSGSYLAAGQRQVGDVIRCFRSVLNFGDDAGDISVPLAAELVTASIKFTKGDDGQGTLYVDNTSPLSFRAYDTPALDSTSITHTNWTLADAALADATLRSPPILVNATQTGDFSMSVTDIVQNWVDRGAGAQTMLLREEADDDGVVNNMMRFTTNASYALSVTYAERGWYTFQGNARRTGSSPYAIDADAERQWWQGLPSATGQLTSLELPPAIVAVPNSADPDSGLPIIYAAITNDDSTVLYRVEDGGTTRTVSSTTISDFQATGTPLVLAGATANDPDEVYLAGNTVGMPYGDTAAFRRINALTSGGTTTWTSVWGRYLGTDTWASPAYYPGGVTYTYHYFGGGTVPVADSQAIIVCVNYDEAGYMLALSRANGQPRWGHVDYHGELMLDQYGVPLGLEPFGGDGVLGREIWRSTESSPCLNSTAYANDESCWINARNLYDGSYLWSRAPQSPTVHSTISTLNGWLHYGNNGGNLDSAIENEDRSDMLSSDSLAVNQYVSIWPTGAHSPETATIVFGDDDGYVYFLDSDLDPNSPQIATAWTNEDIIGSTIRCSALAAGVPGSGTARAFVGSDDQFVHVLNPGSGELITGSDGLSVLVGNGMDGDDPNPLNGAVRASMAAYQGRLYVLSSGTGGIPYPILYCFE